MPRSDRDIFDDHVMALVRQLGVQTTRLSEPTRRRLLDDVRRRRSEARLNDHEAALTFACGHARALIDLDRERARVLTDRLRLVGRQWCDEGLARAAVLAPLERELEAALREAGR